MKLRKGLAAVLSLVVSTSMIAFAQEDITKRDQTKVPNPIEVLAEEQLIQDETQIEQVVVQPPKDVSEVEVPAVVVPPIKAPAEEPKVVPPVVVPQAEEPKVVPPVVVPQAEEPKVVPPSEVVVPPVVEVKPATLKIINRILGEEDIVVEEEIKDLVAGQVIDMSNYLHEDEFVKLVNQVENIQLKEGENELIVEYKFREDVQFIRAAENTYKGENIS